MEFAICCGGLASCISLGQLTTENLKLASFRDGTTDMDAQRRQLLSRTAEVLKTEAHVRELISRLRVVETQLSKAIPEKMAQLATGIDGSRLEICIPGLNLKPDRDR